MRNSGRLLLIAVLIATVLSLPAAAQNWTTVTSGWQPKRITYNSQGAWAATDGGLVHIDPQLMTQEMWTIESGLYTNSLNVVVAEPGTDYVWVGYGNAVLERIDSRTGIIEQRFLDFHNESDIFEIYDIAFGDHSMFVATDIGVSQLVYIEEYEKWVVQSNFRGFGGWARPTKVNAVSVLGDSLYVGTHDGLAVGNLNDELQGNAAWNIYNILDYFPPTNTSNYKINMLRTLDGKIYISSYGSGLYTFENGEYVRLGSQGQSIFGLTAGSNGSLYAANYGGLRRFDPSDGSWDNVDEDNTKISDVIYDDINDVFWCAIPTQQSRYGGVGQWNESTSWFYFLPNTPGGSEIINMKATDEGDVYVAARDDALGMGVYRLRNGIWEGWTSINVDETFFYYVYPGLEVDAKDNLWIGSRGSGLLLVENDTTVNRYYAGNLEYLKGTREGVDFTVISDFAYDESRQGMWLTNTLAYDGYILKFVPQAWIDGDHTVEWLSFSLVQNSGYSSLLEIDNLGRLWIAPDSDEAHTSLIVFDPGTDLTDQADDVIFEFDETTDLAGSSANFYDMMIDREGLLWLGGRTGLVYLDTNEGIGNFSAIRVSGAIGSQVYALAEDPLRNIWVGTEFGVSVLGPDRYTWIRNYTDSDGSHPSPLIASRINALAFDGQTGKAYMGTEIGLSILNTPFLDFGDNIGNIKVRPQPFKADGSSTNTLRFVAGLGNDRGTTVRFFTPSGKMVRELTFDEAAMGWDGRDEDGDIVASGVYYILVTDADGNSETGKAAIIRN